MDKAFYMTFGRLNPPTTGHYKLLKDMIGRASRLSAKPVVFLSQSQDAKNPLSFEEKSQLVKKALPSLTIGPKEIKNPYDALKWAQMQGAKAITLLVGEDRIANFKSMVATFKKNEDPQNLINAQVTFIDRKDNISATMARTFARQGDLEAFKRIMMPGLSETDIKSVLTKIRTRLGPLKEGTIMNFTELDIESEESGFFDFVIEDSDIEESSQFVITLLEEDDKEDDKEDPDKKSKDRLKKLKDRRDPDGIEDDDKTDDDSDKDNGDDDEGDSKDDKKSDKKSSFPPKKKDSAKDKGPGDKEPAVPEKKGPAKGKGSDPTNDVDNVNLNDGPVDSDVKGNEPTLALNPPEKLKFALSQKISSQQDKKKTK